MQHPFSRCYTSLYGAIVSQELDDEPSRERLLQAAENLAADERFDVLATWVAVLRHFSLARHGDRQAANAMRKEIGEIEQTRRAPLVPYFLTLHARACLAGGEPTQGLEAVDAGLRNTQRTAAWYMESELQRLRGALLVATGAEAADIARAFGLAQEIACRQDAKALALRVAGELTRWRPAPRSR